MKITTTADGGYKSADGTGARATFLYRNPETECFRLVETDYDGPVPLKVWKRLNKQFLKLDGGGSFYPLDGTDAYQEAVGNVCAAAEKLSRGEIALKKSDAEKYLSGVAFRALAHFCSREVLPTRDEYRAVERSLSTSEKDAETSRAHDAPEGRDAGYAAYADAAENGAGAKPQPLTAQQLAETLPAIPDARERRLRAALELEEIYAALLDAGHVRIVCAFRAFVLEDGHFPRAARRARITKTTYYREWPVWLAAARKVGEKTAALRH